MPKTKKTPIKGEDALIEKITETDDIIDEEEEIESLDSIKKRFQKKSEADGSISQDELFDAIEHLDLSDEDTEKLVLFFKNKGIDVVIDEDEDMDNIEVDEKKIKEAATADFVEGDLFES